MAPSSWEPQGQPFPTDAGARDHRAVEEAAPRPTREEPRRFSVEASPFRRRPEWAREALGREGGISGCATEYNLVTKQEEWIFYDTDKEVRIGESVAKAVEEEYEFAEDPLMQKRVEDIGEKIVAVCDRKEIKYYFTVKDQELFAMAGLYSLWKKSDGTQLNSFTVITKEADQFMSSIHHRMPIILEQKDYATWLDNSSYDANNLELEFV